MNDSSNFNSSVASIPATESQSERGVHQLGYRAWSGWKVPGWTRWAVIASAGTRRAWQNSWLKRLLFFAWLPAIWFGLGFFVWEQAALYPEWRISLRPMLSRLPPGEVFDQIKRAVVEGDFSRGRHTVWAWLLNSFFRYPQSVVMVLVIGLISPPLISQDIRSRAFLIYFSRPLTRIEYIIGKMASLWAYLAMISVLPALSLYVLGVLLSPSASVIWATWDLPIRVVLASVVLMLPTSALALCYSSLTQESRYAGFAWFATFILGWFTYAAASSAETFNAQQRAFHQHRMMGIEELEVQESIWTHLSLYHVSGRVQGWVFGFSSFMDVLPSVIILLSLTTVSLIVLFRRISAPMQV